MIYILYVVIAFVLLYKLYSIFDARLYFKHEKAIKLAKQAERDKKVGDIMTRYYKV